MSNNQKIELSEQNKARLEEVLDTHMEIQGYRKEDADIDAARTRIISLFLKRMSEEEQMTNEVLNKRFSDYLEGLEAGYLNGLAMSKNMANLGKEVATILYGQVQAAIKEYGEHNTEQAIKNAITSGFVHGAVAKSFYYGGVSNFAEIRANILDSINKQ